MQHGTQPKGYQSFLTIPATNKNFPNPSYTPKDPTLTVNLTPRNI